MEKARRWSGAVGLRLNDVELAIVICGVDVVVVGCADEGTKGGWDRGGEGGGGHGPLGFGDGTELVEGDSGEGDHIIRSR